jgi:hypothetical protein
MTLPPPLHFDLLKHSNSVGRTQIELFAVAFGPGLTILPTRPKLPQGTLFMIFSAVLP